MDWRVIIFIAVFLTLQIYYNGAGYERVTAEVIGNRKFTAIDDLALMVSMYNFSIKTALLFLKEGAQFYRVEIYNAKTHNKATVSCLFLPLLYKSFSYYYFYAAVSEKQNEDYLNEHWWETFVYFIIDFIQQKFFYNEF